MRAYCKWLVREFGEKRELIAEYMLATHSPENKTVWSLLEETGDTRYTIETFFKAADIAIERARRD